CRGQYDRVDFLKQFVFQQSGDIYRRSAQEEAAAAALGPIDKLLVLTSDDELQIEFCLSNSPHQVFNFGRLFLERVERCLQTAQRAIERDVKITKRGRLQLAFVVPASETSRDYRIASFLTATFTKTHPEVFGEPHDAR